MPGVTLQQLLVELDRLFPLRWAADWDRCGLQVGRLEAPVGGVCLALDLDDSVIDFAKERGADTVITHHPLLFRPLGVLCADGPIAPSRYAHRCAAEGINVAAMHTNVDRAPWGFNRDWADAMGMIDPEPLEPRDPSGDDPNAPPPGDGLVGDLKEPMEWRAWVDWTVDYAGAPRLSASEWPENGLKIRRVALCGGAGGGLIESARQSGADVYITGEIGYHPARDGVGGPILAEIGHYYSERGFAANMERHLSDWSKENRVAVHLFGKEQEPLATRTF